MVTEYSSDPENPSYRSDIGTASLSTAVTGAGVLATYEGLKEGQMDLAAGGISMALVGGSATFAKVSDLLEK